ncbi:hypothetical protein SLA2020_155960 [Shorea laevis]
MMSITSRIGSRIFTEPIKIPLQTCLSPFLPSPVTHSSPIYTPSYFPSSHQSTSFFKIQRFIHHYSPFPDMASALSCLSSPVLFNKARSSSTKGVSPCSVFSPSLTSSNNSPSHRLYVVRAQTAGGDNKETSEDAHVD